MRGPANIMVDGAGAEARLQELGVAGEGEAGGEARGLVDRRGHQRVELAGARVGDGGLEVGDLRAAGGVGGRAGDEAVERGHGHELGGDAGAQDGVAVDDEVVAAVAGGAHDLGADARGISERDADARHRF